MLQLAELYSPITDDLTLALQAFDDELISDQGFISDLCQHISRFHGKQLRPALVLLAGKACGGVTPEHHVIAAVVEMVHIATLVHDDILDEADIRRRAATVNRLWGNERAVLMGDFLISHAFHLCSSLDSQYASRQLGATTNAVCEGELMQVTNQYNYALTEAQYFDIVSRKTAVLIAACCQLGAHFAGAERGVIERLRRYGRRVGAAFQIVDDVLDLLGDEAEVGKSLGRDVDEGKLTLPLIHYLREASATEREHMMHLLTCDRPRRHGEIARLLVGAGSVDYARNTAQAYVAEARECLDVLRPTEARESLRAMAEFILQRQH